MKQPGIRATGDGVQLSKFWLVRIGSILLALAFAFGLQMATSNSAIGQRLVVLAGLYVTLAVSLNLINGVTGQFSIGHAAFYQVGAYTTGYLAANFHSKTHLPDAAWLFIMVICGACAAMVAGLVVGLPSLRLKGDYLAIVTLGFGEIIRIVVQNQPALGSAYGLTITPQIKYVWPVWLLAILCIAVCRNLLKTAHGLPFLAVREDEVASAAMGVKVTQVKVVAFLIGSAFAGAAGAVLAHYEAFISPDTFSMDLSFIIVTMVVLGGTGSITGSALAAVLLFYLPEKMRDLKEIPLPLLMGIGVAVIFTVVAFRWLAQNEHGATKTRVAKYLGVLGAAIVGTIVLRFGFGAVPAFNSTVDGIKLRLVLFAVTLIVLMLLRPQGVFAHHEFSWSWVRKIFGAKDVPQTEVAA